MCCWFGRNGGQESGIRQNGEHVGSRQNKAGKTVSRLQIAISQLPSIIPMGVAGVGAVDPLGG